MQTSFGEVTSSASPDLRNAIRFALATGVGAAAAFNSAPAVAAEEEAGAQGLEEVIVTGTRIRRVDAETANPVLTIDKDIIEQSGITTAGDLVSRIPSVSGAATNPQVNNGGGFGEANIELRGLDAKRTLILLNGRRVGLVGASGAVDVNQIPVNIIEKVDVLKEGAGAIYGSDAIAGVVNFITRKNFDGLEIGGEYGATGKSDGKHESINMLWGTSSEKGSMLLAGSYTKQDAVSAADRNFSKDALYLYSGSSGRYSFSAGSSRVPSGRATLPGSHLIPGSTTQTFGQLYGCTSNPARNQQVTRNPGAAGTSLSDYSCLHSSFNYQPYNLLMTPAERGSLFATGTYKITDDIEAYTEALVNKTHSGFEIAPLPFDASADDVIISAANEFNPFGIDFGGLETTNPNYRTRFLGLGTRHSSADTDTKMFNAGLRGSLFNTGWDWDANLSYNRLDQAQRVEGYVYFPALQNAVGPSFQDGAGVWHCGTDAAHEIAGCTPINFFNQDDPATIAALNGMSTSYHTNNVFVTKGASLNLNGKLFELPAGAVQGAVGFEYRKLETTYDAEKLVQGEPPLFLKCLISNEACTGNTVGEYSSKEYYAEALVPVLKDMPGAQQLDFDASVRFSDYSKFGNTTKGSFKVEYRPIKDLMIRASYEQVFRVPTLADLYAAPANTSATFTDPCYGVTAADVAGNPNLGKACLGAALDGSFSYNGTSQITGLILSNPDLKPESGNVITYGFVLQVPHVEDLSVTVDSWRYDIKNLITTLDPNFAIQQCIATGANEFCNLLTRYTAGTNQGQIEVFNLPTINLGEIKTSGIDIGIKYGLRDTRIGSFRFGLDATYTQKYEVLPGHGAPAVDVAGTYDRQFGNYAKWRGTGSVGWALGDFDGLMAIRYIHNVVVHDPATECAVFFCPDFVPNNVDLEVPKMVYLDLTLGYSIKKTNTKFQLGVRNLTDKQPPILYMNNVTNANTDVATYDLLGRQWFATFTQKF
ncbi:MAG: TonB-dependent receptor [Steroidobacteraceae bacterium]